MANSTWTPVGADDNITSIHFRGELNNSYTKNWLISPTIDLTQDVGRGLILQFDACLIPYGTQDGMAQRYLGEDDRFILIVSKDNGKSWEPTDATIWDNKQQGKYTLNDLLEGSTTYYINMTDYVGSKIKIGFYLESTVKNTDNFLHISHLSLDSVPATFYDEHVCQGNDYTEHGFTLLASKLNPGLNTFSKYTPQDGGRGLLEVLRLNVETLLVTTILDNVCVNSRYRANGFDTLITPMTESPLVRFLSSQNGCDSLVEVRLNITRPVFKNITERRCIGTSFKWKGQDYYTSQLFMDTTSSLLTGCDSITRIFFDVTAQFETTVFDTVCFEDSLFINGERITTSGTYEEPLRSKDGCDSLVIHQVAALPPLGSHTNIAVCIGHSYTDQTFQTLTEPGIYEQHNTSKNGCDSTVLLKLLIGDLDNNFYDTITQDALPYLVNGMALLPIDAATGQYIRSINLPDCGTSTVNITVIHSAVPPEDTTHTRLNELAYRPLTITPNIVSVGESFMIVGSLTDAELHNLQLTIFNTAGMTIRQQTNLTQPLIIKGIDASGVYFIRLMAGSTSYVGMVIVK